MIKYIDGAAELELSQQKEVERVRAAGAEREREVVERMLQRTSELPPEDEKTLEAQPVDVTIKTGPVKKEKKVASLFSGAPRAPKLES